MEIKKFEILKESKWLEKHRSTIELALDMLKNIGEGGNAYVKTWEKTNLQDICLKEIKKIPQLKGNNLLDEFDFQNELVEQNVSVPKPLLVLKKQDGSSIFIMERIPGSSIEDISKGLKKLPADFKLDSFFEKLKLEVKKMHQVGLIHRDLRSGNVMINKEGEPYLIDFGTAVRIASEKVSDLYYEESVLMWHPQKKRYELKTGYFLRDEEALSSLQDLLKPIYWRAKGFYPKDQFGQPTD